MHDPALRFAAIGDSFTEGVGDLDENGQLRGWADIVAETLAARNASLVYYANLAVRGRLLAPIVAEQLTAALSLDPPPTLVSLNGGGNDLLRPRCNIAELAALTDDSIQRCVAAGVQPLILSGPDPSRRLPWGAVVYERGARLSASLAALASARGVLFVDLFCNTELRDPRYWSTDRIHLNGYGHRRVAHEVLVALGASTPEPLNPSASKAGAPWSDLVFVGAHLVPWLIRRVRRRSSGDGRVAKHSGWTQMTGPPV